MKPDPILCGTLCTLTNPIVIFNCCVIGNPAKRVRRAELKLVLTLYAATHIQTFPRNFFKFFVSDSVMSHIQIHIYLY